ncbi:MAG: hypothetical protein B7X31_10055 [Thiomonas sp. 13-66-29]|jgi:hypothetical protein|nr:MAG: hypothetical protein B7X31_10055 [Thiomonas sp. 13-66-29]
MQRTLVIDLLDDCVFSARSATSGGHASLDRIPGASLLGAAANALYAQLAPHAAFDAFHSGRLRFGDGLPWDGHTTGHPMPLSWHHAKVDKAHREGGTTRHIVAERIYNFQHCNGIHGSEETQPKQLRDGYIHANGQWSKPRHSLHLKTAIDAATARAAEGQLFGYDALEKGQTFAARIEADDDFDPDLFSQVLQTLCGDILLGRSRSAEYGRVRARLIDGTSPQPGPMLDQRLTLWLLSDLALCTSDGQPTLTPDAESLGLPGESQIVWGKTFLRQRRYSPWNAARRGYDSERVVLAAGGVITIQLPAPLDPTAIAALQAGLGLHREAGLGRLWVNPPLLADRHPVFVAPATSAQAQHATARPNHPLLDWLDGQNTGWKEQAESEARKIASEYAQQITVARSLLGEPEGSEFGPSKAQWGRLLEAARQMEGQALFDALFQGDSAIVKPTGKGWDVDVLTADGLRLIKLADWLRSQLPYQAQGAAANQPAIYAHRVRQLAHRVRGNIDKRQP